MIRRSIRQHHVFSAPQAAEASGRLLPLGVTNLVRRGVAMLLSSGSTLPGMGLAGVAGPTTERLEALTGDVNRGLVRI